jgi:hypothetical protein
LAQPPVAAPSASNELLFLESGLFENTLVVNSEFKLLGIIPFYGFEAVSPDGTFYVSPLDQGYATTTVEIYAPPYKEITATLSFPQDYSYSNGYPDYVDGLAVDARTGLLAVTTQNSDPNGGPGYVTFFQAGSTHPCNNVSFAYLNTPSAIDAEGTLYTGAGQTQIASISGGCQARKVVVRNAPPGMSYVGDITFDADDHLLMQAPESNVIEIYPHPGDGPFKPAIASTTLQKVNGHMPYLN